MGKKILGILIFVAVVVLIVMAVTERRSAPVEPATVIEGGMEVPAGDVEQPDVTDVAIPDPEAMRADSVFISFTR